MKNLVIAIQSSVITTIIVYALLVPIFFEFDNALGEGENFVVNNNDKTMMYSQQAIEEEEVETECKSPCPSSAEMCIEMCA
jgi:hypothetical protein